MAGQKSRIDKDSKHYLDKNARPESEQETAYDNNKDLEGPQGAPLDADRNGNSVEVFSGNTKKDTSRKADQKTGGTTGIGDTASGLEKSESVFASVIRKRFFSESENPGQAAAPASSDNPSLGMVSINNTDFRQPQADVRSVLESIALQAAETFEMMDENSKIPDPITNELSNTAKAISKIYEYVSNSQSDTAEPNDNSPVPKETPTQPQMKESRAFNDKKSYESVLKKAATAYKQHGNIHRAIHDHDLLPQDADKIKNMKESTEARPYIVVHARKGRHETTATSSYEAAKKAATAWGLKSTAGIDAHLADVKHSTASIGEETEELDEKLIGNQKNIDKNHNGKLDAHDFKLLRSKKTMKEAIDIVFSEILRGKINGGN